MKGVKILQRLRCHFSIKNVNYLVSIFALAKHSIQGHRCHMLSSFEIELTSTYVQIALDLCYRRHRVAYAMLSGTRVRFL